MYHMFLTVNNLGVSSLVMEEKKQVLGFTLVATCK